MDLVRKSTVTPRRLGILPAAWHPPTRAHLALAAAPLDQALVDEVLLVLPRRFPHEKEYGGIDLGQRLRLIEQAAQDPRCSIGVSDGGLFVEIAREIRPFNKSAEIWFLCGRDAAERIVNWDYGRPAAFREMLGEFGLLVADRAGRYKPPPDLAPRIRPLPMPRDWSHVSSTEVRERIRRGEPWEDLVPPEIADLVREIYTSKA